MMPKSLIRWILFWLWFVFILWLSRVVVNAAVWSWDETKKAWDWSTTDTQLTAQNWNDLVEYVKNLALQIEELNNEVFKSCTLAGIEVKYWESYKFYSNQSSNNCSFINRTCETWGLSWSDNYKYAYCSPIATGNTENKCTISGVSSPIVWSSYPTTHIAYWKSKDLYYVSNCDKVRVTCKDWELYTQWGWKIPSLSLRSTSC